MYRDSIPARSLRVRKFNKNEMHLVCRVDQFNAQEFNKNDFGWSCNSISAMAKATTYSQFMAIAQQVSKTPKQFNLPDGCSVKDAIALCRPRIAQSPAELDIWAEQIAHRDMEKLNDAYEKALKDKVLEPAPAPAPDFTPVES